MQLAEYDGEATEVFVVTAQRGIPEALDHLFTLQASFRDRAPLETWKPPFEDASRRAELVLTFAIDRQWLYEGVRAGNLNATAALKKLVLFQDRLPTVETSKFDETPEQLSATRTVWLEFAKISRDPETACAAIGEIIRTTGDTHVRHVGLSLLVMKARAGWHQPGTQTAASTLTQLTLKQVPGAFPALLQSLKRMVPIEMLECLRSLLKANLHAEEVADELFTKSLSAYERVCQIRPHIASENLEEKLSHCSPWIGLLSDLQEEHPALRRRLEHLHSLLKANTNGSN